MKQYQIKSRVDFPISLHAGVDGKAITVKPGEVLSVSEKYLDSREMLGLLDKRWVEVVIPWELDFVVPDFTEELPIIEEKKPSKRGRKKKDVIVEESTDVSSSLDH